MMVADELVVDGGVDIGVGQALTVAIDPEKIYIFDKETGQCA